ncbi:tyrosine-type recombinase/integrase [Nocardia farcinica]|uniref:tyrosine-type recombinase/integrase n=1 Tax=Nocardia farcinica TaxID=37329 RepID=UPI002453F7B0|nr:tyrosine-type recombinase/integrase [Nocardia farcinica]
MTDLDNPVFRNLWDTSGSDNALFDLDQTGESSSDKTQQRGRRSSRRLSVPKERILADYAAALAASPLRGSSPNTYLSQVRGFLLWLEESTPAAGDPLTDPRARDGAVRDYRTYLQTVARRRPATINTALAAVSDFFVRSGLGAPQAVRVALPQAAPRALGPTENLRWLRTVEARPRSRDRVLAYLGRYAGLRIGERVALDVGDIALSARKGLITVRSGKGGRYREVPTHPVLHQELTRWIHEDRPAWPGAAGTDALLLNARGGRLGARGADKILGAIAAEAGITDYSPHVDRHSFATELLRERGVDIVLVAELLGHARLEDTRRYCLPTADEKAAAVAGLHTDR